MFQMETKKIKKDNKDYSILIFDMHNLFYRVYYSIFAKERTGETNSILKQAVKGTFKMIKYYIENYAISEDEVEIYCCFDNPTSKYNLRCGISDQYKKNRKTESENFYKTIDFIKNIILAYNNNYHLVYMMELEADDIILPLLNYLDIKDSAVLLISTDLDWSRCLNYKKNKIDWLSNKVLYTKVKFEQEFGFIPNIGKVCLYKSLFGDKSDGIPIGTPYLPTEIKKRLCNDFDNLQEFFSSYQYLDYLTANMKKIIKENEKQLLQNWQLVSFIDISSYGEHIKDHIYDGQFKKNFLIRMFESFDIPIDFNNQLRNNIIDNANKNLFTQERRKRK